jgi:S1-C subfamily serine protease
MSAIKSIRKNNILLFISLIASVNGAGIAAFKEQSFHSDSSANTVAYKNLVLNDAPLINIDLGGKKITVDKSKLVAKIEIPEQIPQNIINESDMIDIRRSLVEMKEFSTRFPKSAPMLRGWIDSLTSLVTNFDNNQVRLSGNWISRDKYIIIVKNDAEKAKIEKERLRKIEWALKEESRKEIADKNAFVARQRSKGLELYGESWLPKDEVIKLIERDSQIANALELISKKSILNSVFSVFQVTNEGLLIRIEQGNMHQGGINTELVFLFGASADAVADGDRYNGNLYWCGNFSYIQVDGMQRTVNAYSLNKKDAIERIRATLNEEKKPSQSEGGYITSGDDNQADGIPSPLTGATSSGSGFFVGKNGYFITNHHVVENGKNFTIYLSGRSMPAQLIAVSKVSDLALLKVGAQIPGLEIAENEADSGQDVFTIGFPNPIIQGIEPKVTKGIISSKKGIQDDDTRYQIDAAVQPGNSGGPLCDDSGRLIGVVVSQLNPVAFANQTGSIPQNVNYAIKASEVSAILRQKGVSIEGATKPEGVKSVITATGIVIVR